MKQREYKRGIKYYWNVWRTIWKNSFKTQNTYKIEVAVRFIRALFIVVIQLIVYDVVFGDAEYFLGWSRSEAYLVSGMWSVLNYMSWAFFGANLLLVSEEVLSGRFDFIILKPISSAFLASFRAFHVENLVTSISGVFLMSYYFVANWGSIVWANVGIAFISLLFSMLIWFSFHLIANSFTLKAPRNAFWQIAKELLGITKFPIDIFGSSLQWIFYTFFPIAFITTVPANLLVGRISWMWLLGSMGVAVVLLFIAVRIWGWNLNRYSSSGG